MPDKVLFENPFIAVIDRDGYSFLHLTRANGQLVAVLPYQDTALGRRYLARVEICPAHSPNMEPCSVTGGAETGVAITDTASRELREETGYTLPPERLRSLGTVRPSKQSDTLVHLFAADVGGLTAGEITGDGSRFEQGAGTQWVTYAEGLRNKDPLFITMLARLEGDF